MYRLTSAILIICFTATMAFGGTAQVPTEHLKEVIVYTTALRSELETTKQSLESERQAVADMLKAQEQERQAQAEYADALNAELQKAQAENKAVRRRGTIKNCLIVGLAGALIAVIATR